MAFVSFGVALSRAASAGAWRGDLPAVRDLGLVSVGLGGGVSTVVGQALSVLPVGNRLFRSAIGAALALAIAAYFVYRAACFVIARAASADRTPSRLGAPLAAIAALTAALSPAWQREGTAGGGAMIATALVWGTIWYALSIADEVDLRGRIFVGVLVGATVAESPPAAVSAAIAAFLILRAPGTRHRAWRFAEVLARRLRLWGKTAFAAPESAPADVSLVPRARAIAWIAAAALVAALVLSAPVWLRPLAPRAFADLGRFLSTAGIAGAPTNDAPQAAIGAWAREVGVLSLLVAAAGTIAAATHPRVRAAALGLAACVAFDALLPGRGLTFLSTDPLAPVRCIALGALAVGSAFGVGMLAARLASATFPLARLAAALVVFFHLTLVALTSEEAALFTDRNAQTAAEVWTDEALGRLPPNSAVIARSPALAWRFWAARVTRGERPDVLVIPAPFLTRGRVLESVLANERAASTLLRDVVLTGAPSELGLSTLADARPLYVQLFPAWPQRLSRHLRLDGTWLAYAAQPLGPSDRKLALGSTIAPLARLTVAVNETDDADPSTRAIAADQMRDQATLLMMLGEAEAAQTFLQAISTMTREKHAIVAAPPKTAADLRNRPAGAARDR